MITPKPTYSFDTGIGPDNIQIDPRNSPADANVAVSSTHVCVTARAAFACYTKAGTLVNPGPGLQARPYLAADFFTQSGHPIAPCAPGTPTKDGRVVFDQYRKRFFAAFQTREEHCHLLIAVSKSEDPSDGWWTYSDDVLEPGIANGEDYMSLGINASYFLISNRMAFNTGTYPNPPDPNNPWKSIARFTRHFMYRAENLVNGDIPYQRFMWSNSQADGAAPCVSDSYTTDSFWVNRDDDTHVTVWSMREQKLTSRQVTIQQSLYNGGPPGLGPQLGGGTVDYGQIIHRDPQNAQYRDGRIVFDSNDLHMWAGQSTPNNAVRLVRLNVSEFYDPSHLVTVEIDRIFGRASADDPSGVVFDYGWPAVAVNAQGDIVVGSVRSNSTIFAELRASVWFAGQPEISSSISIAKSSLPLAEFHMAGASADPSTGGVYLAQQYGSSPSWRIRVAKMLGQVLPDLIAPQVQPPATIAHGASGKVTVTVTNQGDGLMPAATGRLYLSINNIIHLLGPDIPEDPELAVFQVPALAPNEVKNLDVPFTLTKTQAPGKYFVGVALYSGATEYSKFNNVNPFQFGDHGNAPMTIT